MSKNSYVSLVRIIVNIAIFLEFTSEERLDPDTAVEMMEQISAELQLFGEDDKKKIIKLFNDISKEYEGKESEFVKELPNSLGII